MKANRFARIGVWSAVLLAVNFVLGDPYCLERVQELIKKLDPESRIVAILYLIYDYSPNPYFYEDPRYVIDPKVLFEFSRDLRQKIKPEEAEQEINEDLKKLSDLFGNLEYCLSTGFLNAMHYMDKYFEYFERTASDYIRAIKDFIFFSTGSILIDVTKLKEVDQDVIGWKGVDLDDPKSSLKDPDRPDVEIKEGKEKEALREKLKKRKELHGIIIQRIKREFDVCWSSEIDESCVSAIEILRIIKKTFWQY